MKPKGKTLTPILNRISCQQLVLLVLLFLSTAGLFAQQDFRPRQNVSRRGDVLVTGNTILGLINNPDSPLGPNGAYNGNRSNGGAGNETAYIDIDSDNTTFSSSSADLINPSPVDNCAVIRYAGLYWTANYYLAREQPARNSSADEISTFAGTTTSLTINNTGIAGIYPVRATQIDNDNSNIQLSPASSNLVVVQPNNGCGITNAAAIAGNIAVMNTGGSCSDREKIVNAQAAGAVGVVIINDNGDLHRVTGGGTAVNIPSVTIGNNDVNGGSLITALQAQTNVVNATLSTDGNEIETGLPTTDVRRNGTADYRNIKLGFGTGAGITYVDVTPQAAPGVVDVNGVPTPTHGGVIYDGYLNTVSNPGTSASDNVPYTCYADVTSIVEDNGYGTYTVANMKATLGTTSGVSGAAGGWTLVVIYEDPSPAEDNRFITLFDGFREIQGNAAGTVDIPISGFQTLPPNLPVNVKFGLASLEGDLGIPGDQLGIINPPRLAAPGPYADTDFTYLSNGANLVTNFFNSSVSVEDAITTTRLPNSTNTLGFDVDFFTLGNAGKNLLGNSQTETIFRLRTSRDTYQAFMTLFSVEQIVPELRLLKEVYDPGDLSTVINNQSVELGDFLTYRLRLENIGNEDYKDNVVVNDSLPANVDLQNIDGIAIDVMDPSTLSGNLTSIPSITYQITIGAGGEQVIRFEIPPNLLTHNGPTGPGTGELQIDFGVQLVTDCASLRDACSNEINNVAVGLFTGILSDEPVPRQTNSSSSIDMPCGNTDGEATNFLANVPACEQDVSFCGDELVLVAGGGYDRYVWSGPNGFSAVTSIPQILVPPVTPPATRSGVYTVVKEDTNPADGTCMTLTEEFDVADFNAIAHPLQNDAATESFIDYFDSTNGGCGQPLAKISLCGDETYTVDSERNPDNLTSIIWQELTNDACRDRDDNCPAITGGCDAIANWTTLPSADAKPITYEFANAGEYRVVMEVVGGCTRVFYFDINKNDYQPTIDTIDMECGNPGRVQVNNIPAIGTNPTTFRFLIRDQSAAAPTLPGDIGLFTNSDGRFDIPFQANPFIFTVYAVDTAFPNCVYEIDGTLRSFNPTFTAVPTPAECTNNDNGNGVGSIRVEVTGGIPQYEYRILGGPNNIDIVTGNSDASNGDFTFTDLEPGTYTIEVVSNRNPDPECMMDFTGLVVAEAPTFTAVANLVSPATCDSGAIVEVVVTDGSGGPYEFADSSGVFNSPPPLPAPQDRFQFTLPTTAVPTDVFTFRVNDTSTNLACIIDTQITGIEAYVPIEIASVVPTNPLCPTDLGRVEVTLTPASDIAGRSFTYELITVDETTTPVTVVTVEQTVTSGDPNIAIANIPAGTNYAIRVSHNNTTDPTGAFICPVLSTPPFEITTATAVSFDANLTRTLSCISGSEDAQITISNFMGGVSGTYEWSLTPTGTFTPITTASVAIDVAAAQTGFTVYVRDPSATTCAVSESVDIPELLVIDSIVVANERDSDCVNQTVVADVSALPVLSAADITNGVQYEFTVTPAPASGPATFNIAVATTATAGFQTLTFDRNVNYTITAERSENDCNISTTFRRDLIPEIQILSANETDPVTCMDGNDGAFSFTVDTAQFPTFSYEIYDANPIPNPNTLTPIATGTSSSSTTIIDNTIVALEDGTYTIRVIDLSSGTTAATSCFADLPVTITEPAEVMFTIDPVEQVCPTGTNTVTISNPMGGSGTGYTYILYTASPTAGGMPIGPSRPASDPYENVPEGTGYVIIVTDSEGCVSQEQTVPDIIALPIPAIAEGTVDYCLGDDGEVSFTINVTTLGTGAHTYTVTRDGNPVIPATNINVAAIPVTFTTTPPPTLTQSGVYQFIVTDSKGCSSPPLDILIEDPVEFTAAFVENIRCNVSGNPADPFIPGEISFNLVEDGYVPIAPALYTIEVFRDGTLVPAETFTGAGPAFPNYTTIIPGVYTYRITDREGCTSTTNPIELIIPVDPTFSAAPVSLNCATDTGEVIVNINGPDNYEIEFNSGAAIPVTASQVSFPNIAPSITAYTYTITNLDKGCEYNGSVFVSAPEQITVTEISRDDISCLPDGMGGNISVEGQITLAIDGGFPDASADASLLSYQLTRDGTVTAAFPITFAPGGFVDRIQYGDLDPGNYTLRVTDGTTSTCFIDYDFVIADTASSLTITLDPVATCITGAIANLQVVGGTGPYTIQFESELGTIGPITLNDLVSPGAPFDDHQTLPGQLVFGRFYTFEIVDTGGSGCSFFITEQVLPPAAPTITLGTPVPEQCVGQADGEIEFTVDNYSPDPTTISWEVLRRSDNALQLSGGPVPVAGVAETINTNTFNFSPLPPVVNGLAPGQYYIRVTEDPGGGRGCSTASAFFEIEAATPINLTAGTVINGNCDENSTVTMTTTGGNPFATAVGYQYARIDDDGSGVTPISTPSVLADFPLTTNIIDLGNVNGTVYHIFVIDANGCVQGFETVTAVIDPTPVLSVPIFVVDACNYDNNYTFTATATTTGVLIQPGGTLIYEIDDANDATDTPVEFIDGTSHVFTVTSAGVYNITVRDANDCFDTQQITIYDPLEFNAEFTGVPTCNDPDGVITTTLTSGTAAGTLTYVLTGINGTPNPATAVQAPAGTFTGVPPGEYVVTVTDDLRGPVPGCSFVAPVSIQAPIEPELVPITLPATNPTVSCVGATDGTITAVLRTVPPPSSVDPAATYSYRITAGPVLRPAQPSPVFSGLGAGTYTVEVTATLNNGTNSLGTPLDVVCIDTVDYTIDPATPVDFDLALGDPFSCGVGTAINIATINITGSVAGTPISGGTPPYTVRVTEPAPSGVVRTITVPTPVPNPFVIEAPVITGGIYSIQVFDSNDCPITAQTIDVPGFPIMTDATAAQATAATCVSDEIVTVTVTGGTGNYIFQRVDGTGTVLETQGPIAGTSTNFTLTGGAAGDVFNFVIIDQGTTCTIPTTYTIPEFDNFRITAAQQSPETCFQDEDGRATFTVLGGYIGEVSYTITDASGTVVYNSVASGTNENTDAVATTDDSFVVPPVAGPGLGIGNYTINVVQVTAPQCDEMASFTIMGPANDFELVLDPRNLQEACDPMANGAVQASSTGAQGTVSYTIAVNVAPFTVIETNTDGVFDGLVANTYLITAIDDNGTFNCTDEDTITIAPPADDIVIAPIPDSSVTCFESQDGIITVNVTAGTNAPFRYSLTPAVGTEGALQTSNVFDLLAPGTYTVTVYDELNCTETAQAIINEPTEVMVSFTASLIDCTGNPNPTVDVTVTGTSDVAITNYVVEDIGTDRLNPPEFSRNTTGIFNLPVGEYRFYVEDADGCRSKPSGSLPVIAIPDVEITLNDRFAFVNCFNGSNGVIDASVTGGTGMYTYTLSTVSGTLSDGTPFTPIVQSGSEFRDLAPAQYLYTVTTDRSCSDVEPFTIINPPEFTPEFTSENVTCEGLDNGFIRVDASGGTPPYSYAINNEAFLNDVSDGEVGLHIFEDLGPGMYEVIAQDALGCSVIMTFDITAPPALMVATVGDPTPETCFGDADGAVTIIVTGGTEPYRTSLTNNDADFVQDMFTYEDLPAGISRIFVRDANDCPIEITVDIPPGIILEGTLSDRLECPVIDLDGNVTQPPRYFVDVVLGENSVTTDIIYTLTGVNGTPNPPNNTNMDGTFEVPFGEYEATLLHADGCSELVEPIVVEEYTPMSLPLAQMTNNPQDPNEYAITVTGGERLPNDPFYTFLVGYIGLTGTEVPLNQVAYNILVEGNIFRIRQTGYYAIRVIDANGCEVISTQMLTYINIRIPNYFRPNPNGNNPGNPGNPGNIPEEEMFWYPRPILPPGTSIDDNPSLFENMQVTIFDRYGRMLKEFRGDQQGWDGIYQGKELPSGDYWFTIILNDIDNRQFTGHFTLYR